MDLAGLVESFATGTYTVTRNPTAPFVRGVAQPSTQQTFAIRASVQPASGKDLLRLPEGRRSNETRVIYTTTKLFVGDAGDDYEPDTVSIDGADWEVQHVETWVQAGLQGTGYRCIAQAPMAGA
jgi:hypothetical protein